MEGERTTILTFLERKEWRNVLEDRDLKDHCLLSLGLNIGLFIPLNGFTKPNVDRNVFSCSFSEPSLNRSPLTPQQSSAVLCSHTQEPWAHQGEQGQENECGWDFGMSRGESLPKPRQ